MENTIRETATANNQISSQPESTSINQQHTDDYDDTNFNFTSTQTPHINTQTGHLTFGDILRPKTDNSTIRVYLQNINGCKLYHLRYECQSAIQFLYQNEMDIISLTETRTEWNSTNYNKFKQILNQQFSTNLLSTSHYNKDAEVSYHPGGTATIITGSLTSRKRETISDPLGLGRWSGFSIQLKNSRKLYIITAYRPNQDNKFGSNTTYQQQIRYFRLQGHVNPDPRKLFLSELTTLITKIHQQNDLVLLNWDANEEASSNHLSDFLQKTQLISLMQTIYDKMATYARGRHIIDHIMGSPALLPYINRSGYLPFYSGAWISDHRPLYIDINGLFTIEPHSSQPQRRLKSNNKKAIEKFLKAISYSQLTDLHNEITNLDDKSTWTTTDHTVLENIDNQFTELLLSAETTLKAHYNHDWSVKLHELYGIYIYWKTLKMSSSNKIRSPTLLQNLKNAYGNNLYQGNARRSIYGQYKLSIKQLQKCRANSAEHRINSVDIQTSQALAENKTSKAQVLRQIKKVETKQRYHRTLKSHNKPKSTSGVSHILIKKHDTIQRIDDKVEIENTLHSHFQQHFNQATGTPFTHGILRQTFGYSGVTEHTEALLRGELPRLETSTAVQQFLLNIRRSRPAIPSHFPPQDMKQGFLKWRESTTTSPSGKHLGFYKSMIKAVNHNIRSSDEDENLPSKAMLLFNIQQLLINLAIREIHTFERWKVVHNFVIEKIPGYPIISKLRVIHLFEADWNIILKYFTGRVILRQAAQDNTLREEQAGGRPGRRAIDEAVQAVLTYETCILQHQTGGITYNDAKSCYDRIPENLSNIAAMKEGLPHNLALLHANTMQNIKYHLKHQQGIATTPNQHSNQFQFHGVGQGAGDAPARWGYISDNAIVTYNQHSTPAILRSPITNITTDKRLQAFVDDCRLFNINPAHLIFAAFNNTLQNTQLWETNLHTISGKLELDKSKICVFGWRYDHDGNIIADDTYNNVPSLIMESESNQPILIGKILMSEAYKLLSVFLPFYGNMTEHRQHLLDKCQKFIIAFNHIPLPPSGILMGIKTTINPALSYSLPATYIEEKHINSITNKLNFKLLPKLGLNRHFPKVLLTAPTTYGGLNLLDLYDQQGFSHIDVIYRHFKSQTSLTQTIIQATESFHIKCGIVTSCWMDTKPVTYVAAPWINVTRQFMHSIHLTMEIPQLGNIVLLRENDKQLMSVDLQQYLTSKETKIFNNTRLFLQVNNLAEITNNEGTFIHPQFVTQTPPKHRITINGISKLGWPAQPPPNRRMWRVWKKGLRIYCHPSSTILKERLGHWLPACNTQRQWLATELSSGQILVKDRIWKNTSINTQTYTPTDLTPTTNTQGKPTVPLRANDTCIIISSHRRRIGVLHQPPRPWYYYLQQNVRVLNTINPGIIQIHVQGLINKKKQGFAWSIRQAHQTKITHTSTTSTVYQPNTVLATLIGIISALTYINQHHSHHPIELHTNEDTIKFLKTTSLHKYNNYIVYLHHLRQHLNWTLKTEYNEELLHLAKTTTNSQDSLPSLLLPTTVIGFFIKNKEITTNLREIIRNERHKTPIKEYLTNKYHWSDSTFNIIDWKLQDHMVRNTPHREFTIKFIHRWLPVASHPSLNNENQQCIRCNASIEDQDHWYRCPHNRPNIKEYGKSTQKFMEKIHIHQNFQLPILDAIYSTNVEQHALSQKLYNQQSSIGWQHLIRGRISKYWIKAHNKITGKSNSRLLFQQLIHHINATLFRLWKDRNDDIHKTDCHIQQRYFQSFVAPRIQFLYSKKDLLPAIDQRIFPMSLQEMLSQPKKYAESWLNTNEKFLKISVQRESKRLKEGNTNITSFFPPNPGNTQRQIPRRQTQPQTRTTTSTSASVYQRQATISQFFQVKSSENSNSDTPLPHPLDNVLPQPPHKKNDLRPP
jgi:hypothetical protein